MGTYAKLLIQKTPEGPIGEPETVPPRPIEIEIIGPVDSVVRDVRAVEAVRVIVAVYGVVF